MDMLKTKIQIFLRTRKFQKKGGRKKTFVVFFVFVFFKKKEKPQVAMLSKHSFVILKVVLCSFTFIFYCVNCWNIAQSRPLVNPLCLVEKPEVLVFINPTQYKVQIKNRLPKAQHVLFIYLFTGRHIQMDCYCNGVKKRKKKHCLSFLTYPVWGCLASLSAVHTAALGP